MSALIWQKEKGNFQLWTYFAETQCWRTSPRPPPGPFVSLEGTRTSRQRRGRQGGLKITSTLGGNHSVSPRRHGALKYERYDGSRLSLSLSLSPSLPFLLHPCPCRSASWPPSRSRHPVPRWCISANLRSLVLPLSFLPASPLVFLSLLVHVSPSPPVFFVLEDPPPSPSVSLFTKGYTERRG